MADFFEATSLTEEERKKLEDEIERRIVEKIKAGTLTRREVREIEEMRLRPLPDIQDVQNVYENHLFKKPSKSTRESEAAVQPLSGGSHEPRKTGQGRGQAGHRD